ncbi:MAG: bi-domain-containing oxidoreductase [Acidobacteriota bacterium]
MKQVVQNLKTGDIEVREVAEPALRPGGLLVRTRLSLISTGTERKSVQTGQLSLLGKARSRPDLVNRVIDFARREGVASAYRLVKDRLDAWQPLGYSSVGEVIDPGDCLDEFQAGDRVACAGLGYASHAEVIFVPRNLCLPIPDSTEDEQACFTTLASIALQGLRQAETVLGDVVLVTGLGLVGLLSVQLLKAAGAVVIGLDPESARQQQARELGADEVRHPEDPQLESAVSSLTRGRGVDQVLLTAGTPSSSPAVQGAHLLRDRGRLVVVGAVGMNLPRSPFYEKEIEIRHSRSYGPGRYDSDYEEKGRDYPVGYIRWTERRNMEAVLSLMASGGFDAKSLISHRFPLEKASEAYRLVTSGKGGRALAVLFSYPAKPERPFRAPVPAPAPGREGRCVLGWIGVGKFAEQYLLPHFRSLAEVELRRAASATGLSAARISERYRFTLPSAGVEAILEDESVNTVVITTRHDSHASLVLRAMEAGKGNIFVEKPLAIRMEDVEEVHQALQRSGVRLMIGFNRRFAPATIRLRDRLAQRMHPCMIYYRVNAGYCPPDHWTQDPQQGGGRLLGEVCHFVDLLLHLVGSPVAGISATGLNDSAAYYQPDDNFSCLLRFRDGSLATVSYLANGSRLLPKERVEVFVDGETFVLDDFRLLRCFSNRKRTLWKGRQDKGHRAAVRAFVESICKGEEAPIPAGEVIVSSRLPFLIREALQTGAVVQPEP